MDPMTDSGIGLRALKKQMTRESIADAALQLALDKGLDHVTIEEIAQVAFISPRTFSNYYSCKEEAVVAAGGRQSVAVLEALGARSPTEPPLTALRETLVDLARRLPAEEVKLYLQKFEFAEQNPSLRPWQVAQYDAMEAELRQIIAERTQTDPARDVYPWLVAAAAVAVVRAVLRVWAGSERSVEQLPKLIDDAFGQIADGLPQPPQAPTAAQLLAAEIPAVRLASA